MIIKKKNKFLRFIRISSIASVMTLSPILKTLAQEMPTGASVVSGNVSISGQNTDHMVVNQSTHKSIINWQSFSIHENGRVDFNMPNSKSMSLNRISGASSSRIAGQLNSNGQVYLINPHGIIVTPSGKVKTNSFTASSLDINNKDFLNNNFIFNKGNKGNKGIINSGRITVESSGNANLFGSNIINDGTINAKLGKINLGAGEKITLDIEGDGLMSVILPVEKLDGIKDINGNSIRSLISNNGRLVSEGGFITLSAATANSLSTGAINLGSSSELIASTYNNQTGKVQIGGSSNNYIETSGKIDVSSKVVNSPSGSISIKGKNVFQGAILKANGSNGGKIDVLSEDLLVLNGKLEARGLQKNGGSLIVMSENSLFSSYKNILDASGVKKGGNIRSIANNYNLASGKYIAKSSSGQGGKIDITANYLNFDEADVIASGKTMGGKTRVGGEYLGGKLLASTSKHESDGFIGRFGDQNKIKNAKHTIVGTNSTINVSSSDGKGGTVVVWSDEITDFSGIIKANGADSGNPNNSIANVSLDNNLETGGFVEISSSDLLRNLDLSNVNVRNGTLLLDPKNITVDGSSGSGSLSSGLRAQVYSGYFNDNLSFFGSVGGSSQHSSSSIRNRFINDFTRVNYSTPGRNFAEYYSAEWRGFFKPPSTGSYRFATSSDDASWLWLFDTSQASNWSNFISLRSKSNERVDNSRPHGIRTRYSSYVTLQANNYYPILAYFGERTGGDAMLIRWQGPSQSLTDNGTSVYFHNDLEYTSGAFTGTTGGDISTVNAFATDSSSSNTIGSATIANLLTAGTDVYLRANEDITISNAITATGSSGGNLSFLAGRDITINSNITTANGDLTMRANTSTSYGVVDAQRGSGSADIENNATINAGTGIVSAIIDGGSGLTNDQPGSISLGTISARSIIATGDTSLGTITGTSLTASGGGTAINISGYDIGSISSLNAPSGYWRLKRLATNNSTMSNVPSASFIQYNYTNGTSTLGSGNGILHGYNPGVITKNYDYVRSGGSSLGYRANKVYDGGNSTSGVTFGNATVVSSNGLPSEVSVSLNSPNLTYDSKDFNNNSKTIAAGSSYTISSATHSRHGTVHGLSAGTQSISDARISKKPVNLTGIKTYDGTTTARASELRVNSGLVGSETLILSGSGTLNTANAGTKSITSNALGVSLSDGSNGGLAVNYTLTGGTHQMTVGQRGVILSGSRLYDSTTTASSSDFSNITGTVGSETLNITGSGTLGNANVGLNKSVTLGSIALVDGSNRGLANNYSLSSGTLTVNQRPLTATLARQYDGTTTAAGSSLSSLTGLQGGQTLSLTGSGTITTKNVENSKSVTLGSIALADGTGAASNYSLSSAAMNVTKRPIIISGSRHYNGNARVLSSDLKKITGTVGTETLLIEGSSTVSSKDVGVNQTISLDKVVLKDGKNGGLVSNYNLSSGNLTISKRPVNISGVRSSNRGSRVVKSFELKVANIVDGESLKMGGTGSIPNNSSSIHPLTTSQIKLSSGLGNASNYTLDGGKHIFRITYKPPLKKNAVKNKLANFEKVGKKLFIRAPKVPVKPPVLAAAAAPAVGPSMGRTSGGATSSGGGGGSPSSGGRSSGTGSETGGSSETTTSSDSQAGSEESSTSSGKDELESGPGVDPVTGQPL